MTLHDEKYAALYNRDNYTVFEFNGQIIRFMTSSRLERYTKIKEWDHGYIVVVAKYSGIGEQEEYIDMIPILENLYYDVAEFLEPIKGVKIGYTE